MKKTPKAIILCVLLLGMIGCRAQIPRTIEMPTEEQSTTLQDKNILIVYFTRANNIPVTDGMDTTTSASSVLRNEQMVGNTGYVAQIIEEHVGGTLYPIKMLEQYPSEYDPLNDIAKEEGNRQARPEIEQTLPNLNDYDVIFLGYPNWWYDMPMAVYTLLESNDFTNKTILPFVTHGGSGLSSTVETLREILPNATVLDGFEVFQHDVVSSDESIMNWLDEIGI